MKCLVHSKCKRLNTEKCDSVAEAGLLGIGLLAHELWTLRPHSKSPLSAMLVSLFLGQVRNKQPWTLRYLFVGISSNGFQNLHLIGNLYGKIMTPEHMPALFTEVLALPWTQGTTAPSIGLGCGYLTIGSLAAELYLGHICLPSTWSKADTWQTACRVVKWVSPGVNELSLMLAESST